LILLSRWLRAAFFMHDKVYLVNGFAVQAAIGTKTKYCVGFGVHLHARGTVVVEGAVNAEACPPTGVIPVGFQSVMLQYCKDA
jgi:hypothetical protein